MPYGAIWWDGKNHAAHVVSYMVHCSPIADSLFVCHICDFPPCVNPDHLWLGTREQNRMDMVIKGRDAYGSNRGQVNGQAMLKDRQVMEIYRLLEERELRHGEIAERFGVERECVTSINNGKTWSHLAPDGWIPVSDGPAHRKGEESGGAKLKEDEAREIYMLAHGGQYTLREIGDMFGVTPGPVWSIKHKRTWKHLWEEGDE
jgi:hypothetical protein